MSFINRPTPQCVDWMADTVYMEGKKTKKTLQQSRLCCVCVSLSPHVYRVKTRVLLCLCVPLSTVGPDPGWDHDRVPPRWNQHEPTGSQPTVSAALIVSEHVFDTSPPRIAALARQVNASLCLIRAHALFRETVGGQWS